MSEITAYRVECGDPASDVGCFVKDFPGKHSIIEACEYAGKISDIAAGMGSKDEPKVYAVDVRESYTVLWPVDWKEEKDDGNAAPSDDPRPWSREG
jgi:hypothetical protein